MQRHDLHWRCWSRSRRGSASRGCWARSSSETRTCWRRRRLLWSGRARKAAVTFRFQLDGRVGISETLVGAHAALLTPTPTVNTTHYGKHQLCDHAHLGKSRHLVSKTPSFVEWGYPIPLSSQLSLISAMPYLETQPKIIIAGAGIGGLTAALALPAAGFNNIHIFEASHTLTTLGVGINVRPSAVLILRNLGLLAALDKTGMRTQELNFYNRHGDSILSEKRGNSSGYAVPQFFIYRGEFQMLLLSAVKERLGGRRNPA